MSGSQMPSELFRSLDAAHQDPIERVLAALPILPPVIRYYDDFDDCVRSISDPEGSGSFEYVYDGAKGAFDFARFGTIYGLLLKHVFAFVLDEDFSISTGLHTVTGGLHISRDEMASVLSATPTGILRLWTILRSRDLPMTTYSCVKTVLRMLCRHRLNGWSESYLEFLSGLPWPARDAHAGVRSGDVFLSVEEEACIVRYLDSIADQEATESGNAAGALPSALAEAAMVLCAYQFGMRPVQIAKLQMRNVRIWHDASETMPAVHLTFHMAKQKSESKRMPLTRKVKREWAPIFASLYAKRQAERTPGSARFFAVESARDAGSRIATVVRKLIGSNDRGTPTDLRHTAAQRLVDAGASHEELAEFLGHSHIQTGLVYYATSATHAERVNRALGASDIYRRVAKIAHDRFISPEELTQLKGDQQIAGVPHGVPIAGIGGCSSGQPACPYNPITSCYGCRKFLPLHDKTMHERVLAEMREVVIFFDQSSRGDIRSPAYLQLQRTIADIQAVIEELEGETR
ncbi:tyrosine-type recombinase/integrase [Paraburkholderia dipogonis]|jgi:integrase|uniref:Tyrosine-type recombinase/integrase n=1 Tax=Paraburkholderia dipogonis TaxID=1211383 RepID=A0ABW9B872_9BURK